MVRLPMADDDVAPYQFRRFAGAASSDVGNHTPSALLYPSAAATGRVRSCTDYSGVNHPSFP